MHAEPADKRQEQTKDTRPKKSSAANKKPTGLNKRANAESSASSAGETKKASAEVTGPKKQKQTKDIGSKKSSAANKKPTGLNKRANAESSASSAGETKKASAEAGKPKRQQPTYDWDKTVVPLPDNDVETPNVGAPSTLEQPPKAAKPLVHTSIYRVIGARINDDQCMQSDILICGVEATDAEHAKAQATAMFGAWFIIRHASQDDRASRQHTAATGLTPRERTVTFNGLRFDHWERAIECFAQGSLESTSDAVSASKFAYLYPPTTDGAHIDTFDLIANSMAMDKKLQRMPTASRTAADKAAHMARTKTFTDESANVQIAHDVIQNAWTVTNRKFESQRKKVDAQLESEDVFALAADLSEGMLNYQPNMLSVALRIWERRYNTDAIRWWQDCDIGFFVCAAYSCNRMAWILLPRGEEAGREFMQTEHLLCGHKHCATWGRIDTTALRHVSGGISRLQYVMRQHISHLDFINGVSVSEWHSHAFNMLDNAIHSISCYSTLLDKPKPVPISRFYHFARQHKAAMYSEAYLWRRRSPALRIAELTPSGELMINFTHIDAHAFREARQLIGAPTASILTESNFFSRVYVPIAGITKASIPIAIETEIGNQGEDDAAKLRDLVETHSAAIRNSISNVMNRLSDDIRIVANSMYQLLDRLSAPESNENRSETDTRFFYTKYYLEIRMLFLREVTKRVLAKASTRPLHLDIKLDAIVADVKKFMFSNSDMRADWLINPQTSGATQVRTLIDKLQLRPGAAKLPGVVDAVPALWTSLDTVTDITQRITTIIQQLESQTRAISSRELTLKQLMQNGKPNVETPDSAPESQWIHDAYAAHLNTDSERNAWANTFTSIDTMVNKLLTAFRKNAATEIDSHAKIRSDYATWELNNSVKLTATPEELVACIRTWQNQYDHQPDTCVGLGIYNACCSLQRSMQPRQSRRFHAALSAAKQDANALKAASTSAVGLVARSIAQNYASAAQDMPGEIFDAEADIRLDALHAQNFARYKRRRQLIRLPGGAHIQADAHQLFQKIEDAKIEKMTSTELDFIRFTWEVELLQEDVEAEPEDNKDDQLHPRDAIFLHGLDPSRWPRRSVMQKILDDYLEISRIEPTPRIMQGAETMNHNPSQYMLDRVNLLNNGADELLQATPYYMPRSIGAESKTLEDAPRVSNILDLTFLLPRTQTVQRRIKDLIRNTPMTRKTEVVNQVIDVAKRMIEVYRAIRPELHHQSEQKLIEWTQKLIHVVGVEHPQPLSSENVDRLRFPAALSGEDNDAYRNTILHHATQLWLERQAPVQVIDIDRPTKRTSIDPIAAKFIVDEVRVVEDAKDLIDEHIIPEPVPKTVDREAELERADTLRRKNALEGLLHGYQLIQRCAAWAHQAKLPYNDIFTPICDHISCVRSEQDFQTVVQTHFKQKERLTAEWMSLYLERIQYANSLKARTKFTAADILSLEAVSSHGVVDVINMIYNTHSDSALPHIHRVTLFTLHTRLLSTHTTWKRVQVQLGQYMAKARNNANLQQFFIAFQQAVASDKPQKEKNLTRGSAAIWSSKGETILQIITANIAPNDEFIKKGEIAVKYFQARGLVVDPPTGVPFHINLFWYVLIQKWAQDIKTNDATDVAAPSNQPDINTIRSTNLNVHGFDHYSVIAPLDLLENAITSPVKATGNGATTKKATTDIQTANETNWTQILNNMECIRNTANSEWPSDANQSDEPMDESESDSDAKLLVDRIKVDELQQNPYHPIHSDNAAVGQVAGEFVGMLELYVSNDASMSTNLNDNDDNIPAWIQLHTTIDRHLNGRSAVVDDDTKAIDLHQDKLLPEDLSPMTIVLLATEYELLVLTRSRLRQIAQSKQTNHNVIYTIDFKTTDMNQRRTATGSLIAQAELNDWPVRVDYDPDDGAEWPVDQIEAYRKFHSNGIKRAPAPKPSSKQDTPATQPKRNTNGAATARFDDSESDDDSPSMSYSNWRDIKEYSDKTQNWTRERIPLKNWLPLFCCSAPNCLLHLANYADAATRTWGEFTRRRCKLCLLIYHAHTRKQFGGTLGTAGTLGDAAFMVTGAVVCAKCQRYQEQRKALAIDPTASTQRTVFLLQCAEQIPGISDEHELQRKAIRIEANAQRQAQQEEVKAAEQKTAQESAIAVPASASASFNKVAVKDIIENSIEWCEQHKLDYWLAFGPIQLQTSDVGTMPPHRFEYMRQYIETGLSELQTKSINDKRRQYANIFTIVFEWLQQSDLRRRAWDIARRHGKTEMTNLIGVEKAKKPQMPDEWKSFVSQHPTPEQQVIDAPRLEVDPHTLSDIRRLLPFFAMCAAPVDSPLYPVEASGTLAQILDPSDQNSAETLKGVRRMVHDDITTQQMARKEAADNVVRALKRRDIHRFIIEVDQGKFAPAVAIDADSVMYYKMTLERDSPRITQTLDGVTSNGITSNITTTDDTIQEQITQAQKFASDKLAIWFDYMDWPSPTQTQCDMYFKACCELNPTEDPPVDETTEADEDGTDDAMGLVQSISERDQQMEDESMQLGFIPEDSETADPVTDGTAMDLVQTPNGSDPPRDDDDNKQMNLGLTLQNSEIAVPATEQIFDNQTNRIQELIKTARREMDQKTDETLTDYEVIDFLWGMVEQPHTEEFKLDVFAFCDAIARSSAEARRAPNNTFKLAVAPHLQPHHDEEVVSLRARLRETKYIPSFVANYSPCHQVFLEAYYPFILAVALGASMDTSETKIALAYRAYTKITTTTNTIVSFQSICNPGWITLANNAKSANFQKYTQSVERAFYQLHPDVVELLTGDSSEFSLDGVILRVLMYDLIAEPEKDIARSTSITRFHERFFLAQLFLEEILPFDRQGASDQYTRFELLHAHLHDNQQTDLKKSLLRSRAKDHSSVKSEMEREAATNRFIQQELDFKMPASDAFVPMSTEVVKHMEHLTWLVDAENYTRVFGRDGYPIAQLLTSEFIKLTARQNNEAQQGKLKKTSNCIRTPTWKIAGGETPQVAMNIAIVGITKLLIPFKKGSAGYDETMLCVNNICQKIIQKIHADQSAPIELLSVWVWRVFCFIHYFPDLSRGIFSSHSNIDQAVTAIQECAMLDIGVDDASSSSSSSSDSASSSSNDSASSSSDSSSSSSSDSDTEMDTATQINDAHLDRAFIAGDGAEAAVPDAPSRLPFAEFPQLQSSPALWRMLLDRTSRDPTDDAKQLLRLFAPEKTLAKDKKSEVVISKDGEVKIVDPVDSPTSIWTHDIDDYLMQAKPMLVSNVLLPKHGRIAFSSAAMATRMLIHPLKNTFTLEHMLAPFNDISTPGIIRRADLTERMMKTMQHRVFTSGSTAVYQTGASGIQSAVAQVYDFKAGNMTEKETEAAFNQLVVHVIQLISGQAKLSNPTSTDNPTMGSWGRYTHTESQNEFTQTHLLKMFIQSYRRARFNPSPSRRAAEVAALAQLYAHILAFGVCVNLKTTKTTAAHQLYIHFQELRDTQLHLDRMSHLSRQPMYNQFQRACDDSNVLYAPNLTQSPSHTVPFSLHPALRHMKLSSHQKSRIQFQPHTHRTQSTHTRKK